MQPRRYSAILIKSNNQAAPCSVEIKLLDITEVNGNKWQNYQIILSANDKETIFQSQHKTATTAVGTTAEIGKFAFSISPHNELASFKQQLEDFLDSDHTKFRFEPYDPSFELIIERTQEPNEFKVYFWVDAGNTSGLEYSWDSLGLRFISNNNELKKLI